MRMMNHAGGYLRRIHLAAVAMGLLVWICLPSRISAQQDALPADLPAKPVTEETHGFTLWEQFLGSDSSQGQFLVFDSSIGYDFTRHIGVDVGVELRHCGHSIGAGCWNQRLQHRPDGCGLIQSHRQTHFSINSVR